MATAYRILKKLYVGKGKDQADENGYVHRGTIMALPWIDENGIKRLIHRGAISEAKGPPLRRLGRGWKSKAESYEEQGIGDAAQLISADTEELAEKTGKTPQAVERDKRAVKERLTAPPSKGG